MAVLADISRDTQKGFAGICKFLVINTSDCSVAYDTSSGEVSFSNVDDWYTWVPTKETSSIACPLTGSPQTGTSVFAHTANMTFARTESVKRNQLAVMADSEVIVVAVERSGSAWCLGGLDACSSGLDATGGDFTSGAAAGDLSGMTLVLTANMPAPFGIVTDASLAEIV